MHLSGDFSTHFLYCVARVSLIQFQIYRWSVIKKSRICRGILRGVSIHCGVIQKWRYKR